MTIRMTADVGGTNTRIALFDSQSGTFRALSTFLNRDFDKFEDIITTWCENLAEAAPTRACIAIAAVPAGDTISMTNRGWSFSARAVAKVFGFEQIRWINDFEANAFSLPHLTSKDTELLHPGNTTSNNKLAVIGPGTGLGGATIESNTVCACEPGHMSVAPANELEIEVFRILLQQYTQVHAELLVSGPGLLRLYEILADITHGPRNAQSPAEVSRLAMTREDETAVLALSTFCALLGSVAGDFALASGSYGGIFLAGGIVPTVIPFLQASDFQQRLCDKGALFDHLSQIPVYAITTAHPGLIGAAHAPLS